MSGHNPSPYLVLAVTASSAFLEAGKVVNLARAYDTLATLFPTAAIKVAASASDTERCREILGHRLVGPQLVPCVSMEPAALASELEEHWMDSESVLIHDASRPYVNSEQFRAVLNAFEEDVDAVRPSMAFTETLKILNENSVIKETLDRTSVLRISTPELFRTSAIDVNGSDCGWYLPLKANARVIHVQGNPSGLRISSSSDAELMELQQN